MTLFWLDYLVYGLGNCVDDNRERTFQEQPGLKGEDLNFVYVPALLFWNRQW